jgi:hypothetical protein
MNSEESVRGRALSERVGTAAAALAEMVRERQFLLSDEELDSLAKRHEVLAGWVFAYRVSLLAGAAQTDLLLNGLRHLNPRVREQACDLVGDKRLLALRDALLPLCSDSVAFVAEAAKYNYDMLAV